MDIEREAEKACQGKVSGVIIPPPEIRAVVDKTAQFVGKNGKSFEQRILASADGKSSKFNFMRDFDPYHAYYELKIRETEEAIAKGIDPATLIKPAPQPQAKPAEAPAQVKVIASSARAPLLNPIAMLAKAPPTAAPHALEFVVSHPSSGVSAVDIDVIKLTAQFTAVNGREFLSSLVSREQRNPQFDFLKPTHLLFSYFTSLVDSYAKIIHPSPEQRERIAERMSLDKVLEVSVNRWSTARAQREAQGQGQGSETAAGAGDAGIDWYDFTVVEVIDFAQDELLEMAVPVPGMQALALAPPPPPRPPALTPTPAVAAAAMPPPPPPKAALTTVVTEEEDEEGTLKVVTNYQPRIAQRSSQQQPQQVIDPVSGKAIDTDKLEEHMRIQLLDPKWREEQRRFQDKQKESGYAEGAAIADSLRVFARKRGDIFGQAVGGADLQMAQALEEEERRRAEEVAKVTWDGFQGTMAATQRMKDEAAAMASNRPETPSAMGIGPMPSYPMPPAPAPVPVQPLSATPTLPMGMGMGYGMGGMSMGMGMPMMPMGPMGGYPMPMPMPPMPMPMHLPPPPPMPFAPSSSSSSSAPYEDDDNKAKRARTSASASVTVIPADDFAFLYPDPVTLSISLPSEPAFNFLGQTVALRVMVTASAKDVKDALLAQLGSPLGSGKLQLKHAAQGFLKDTVSLAAANLGDGAQLEASIKSRGGKR